MGKIDGPTITVKANCSNCVHNRSVRYAVQGDSGFNVFCCHSSFGDGRSIGDTNWDTPEWCPLFTAALATEQTRIGVLIERLKESNRG